MNLGIDEIMLLLNGLDASIELKEYEISDIVDRTEEDYLTRINIRQRRGLSWDLDEFKCKDIEKVREEIREIERLRESINSGKNHVMLVSKDVRLTLSDSN